MLMLRVCTTPVSDTQMCYWNNPHLTPRMKYCVLTGDLSAGYWSNTLISEPERPA